MFFGGANSFEAEIILLYYNLTELQYCSLFVRFNVFQGEGNCFIYIYKNAPAAADLLDFYRILRLFLIFPGYQDLGQNNSLRPVVSDLRAADWPADNS